MLLPDLTDAGGTMRHLAVGAGKDGNIYVVNRDSMGHFSTDGNNIWQQLTGALGTPTASAAARRGLGDARLLQRQGLLRARRRSSAAFAISGAMLASHRAQAPRASPIQAPRRRLRQRQQQRDRVGAPEHPPGGAVRVRRRQPRQELYDSSQAGSRDQLGEPATSSSRPWLPTARYSSGRRTGLPCFGLLYWRRRRAARASTRRRGARILAGTP